MVLSLKHFTLILVLGAVLLGGLSPCGTGVGLCALRTTLELTRQTGTGEILRQTNSRTQRATLN